VAAYTVLPNVSDALKCRRPKSRLLVDEPTNVVIPTLEVPVDELLLNRLPNTCPERVIANEKMSPAIAGPRVPDPVRYAWPPPSRFSR
jgi:hypothetical protein